MLAGVLHQFATTLCAAKKATPLLLCMACMYDQLLLCCSKMVAGVALTWAAFVKAASAATHLLKCTVMSSMRMAMAQGLSAESVLLPVSCAKQVPHGAHAASAG